MSRSLQIFFFFILTAQICFGQWYQQNSSTTQNLNAVDFLDANNGFAVGDSGTILYTTNGGTNWNLQESGSTLPLNDICFNNASKGWIVGGGIVDDQWTWGILLHTTNGGTDWAQQNSGTILPLNDAYFIDENTGWVVGGGWNDGIQNFEGIVLKTTNGGLNWIIQLQLADSQLTSGADVLNSVVFIDANNGFVVGGFGPLTGGLTKLGLDYAAGVILKTTDGGLTWSKYEISNSYLRGVSQINTNVGTAVGFRGFGLGYMGMILHSIDGWQTWTETEVGDFHHNLNSVHFIDQNNGWISGGEGWGLDGFILHTNDGGVNWVEQIITIGSALRSVFIIDSFNGWAAGDNGTILHTTNGGIVQVELNSFTAVANGKEVTLNWSTATELNNQGFEIQRKFGNNSFSTIGSVKGHGTTTSPNNYTYVDELTDAGKYFYRLKQIDFGGKYEYSQVVEVNWSFFITYKLEQNYPNPFNPTTKISFAIPLSGGARGGSVALKVYDVLGNEVKTLVNKEMEDGYHNVDFNASDLTSGVYFYQIRAGEYTAVKKMILSK